MSSQIKAEDVKLNLMKPEEHPDVIESLISWCLARLYKGELSPQLIKDGLKFMPRVGFGLLEIWTVWWRPIQLLSL